MNQESQTINVCFTIDDNYANHCAVVITSILKNSDSFFHFYILSSELSEENKIKFENLKNIKKFDLSFFKVNPEYFKDCYLPPESHFRPENYYRLKIASLLPKLDRIIYLDADTIANSDIKELWEIPLDNFCMGACKEMTYKRNSLRLGLSLEAPYVNSGVLLINLKKIRENNIESKFFDCIKQNPRLMQNVDQDVINLVLLRTRNGIKQIKQNWNTEVRTCEPFEEEYLPIVQNPYIIHFVTSDKPWNPDSKQLYKEKYLEYAHETQKINHLTERQVREKFIIENYFNNDRTVRQGPFKGMQYKIDKSICSALLPKIYGSYEEPIQKWISEIISRKYDNIIDIGCADGYYAVGLALTSPNSTMYAYDTDNEAMSLCKQLARVNNVELKIKFDNLCTHNDLNNFDLRKTVIICDIEGSERELLDPMFSENLKYADVIVEAHDFIVDGISEILISRFKDTHRIEMIPDHKRKPKITLKEGVSKDIMDEILNERRPDGMRWLRFSSKIN